MTKLIVAFRGFATALKNRRSEELISLRGIKGTLPTFLHSFFFCPTWIEFGKGHVHENLLTAGFVNIGAVDSYCTCLFLA